MGKHFEKKLSAVDVKNKTKPGHYGDGGGLYLQITPGGTKSWVYRYTRGKKQNADGKMVPNTRDMGLGAFPAMSLADARTARDEHRRVLKEQKRDPIDVRNAAFAEQDREDAEMKLAAARRMTFADAVGIHKSQPNYG